MVKSVLYSGDTLELKINAKRIIEKVVKDHGGGSAGRIYLPESWIGKEVIIIEEAKE